MLLYLDNNLSTATHPNENLGRELLELHTVGRGHYTEEDVRNSARILTGWSVERPPTWAPVYKASTHWRGPVQVMGFRDANAAKDGRALTRRYLTYLAHHPATAQRVAGRLATKFVRDDPPRALVDELAQVYLDNDTAIAPVLRALVASKAFAGAVGARCATRARTWWRRTARSTGAAPGQRGVRRERVALAGQPHRHRSLRLAPARRTADRQRLVGQPVTAAGVDAHAPCVERRLVAAGGRPSGPGSPGFRRSRSASTGWSTTSRTCCCSVPVPAAEGLLPGGLDQVGRVITGSHPLVRSQMPDLLATFLDSPEFLTR